MNETIQLIYFHMTGYIQMLLQQATVLNIAKVHWNAKRLFVTITVIYITYISLLQIELLERYNLISSIIWLLFLFISYLVSYKIRALKSGIMAMLQMVGNTALEFVLIFLLSLLPLSTQRYLSLNEYIMRSVVVFIFLTIYLLSTRMQKDQAHDSAQQLKPFYAIYLMILYLFIELVVIKIEGPVTGQYTFYADNFETLINIILILVLYIFNIAYIWKIRKTNSIAQQLQMKELYCNSLEKSSDELRGFKHDFAGIINSISGYVDLEDWDKLKRYMQEVNLDFYNIKTTDIVNSELKEIPLLYGMFLSKLSVAELSGIGLDVSLQCDVDTKFCSILDFSRIIGILLDNAIEAASESDEKYVQFELSRNRNTQSIRISNSCDKPVDINAINRQGYTTKADHSGEGLHQIQLLRNKYKRMGHLIDIHADYVPGQFTQTLTM